MIILPCVLLTSQDFTPWSRGGVNILPILDTPVIFNIYSDKSLHHFEHMTQLIPPLLSFSNQTKMFLVKAPYVFVQQACLAVQLYVQLHNTDCSLTSIFQ